MFTKEFTGNAVGPAGCGLQWQRECSKQRPGRGDRPAVKPPARCGGELRGEMISVPRAEVLPLQFSVCSASLPGSAPWKEFPQMPSGCAEKTFLPEEREFEKYPGVHSRWRHILSAERSAVCVRAPC